MKWNTKKNGHKTIDFKGIFIGISKVETAFKLYINTMHKCTEFEYKYVLRWWKLCWREHGICSIYPTEKTKTHIFWNRIWFLFFTYVIFSFKVKLTLKKYHWQKHIQILFDWGQSKSPYNWKINTDIMRYDIKKRKEEKKKTAENTKQCNNTYGTITDHWNWNQWNSIWTNFRDLWCCVCPQIPVHSFDKSFETATYDIQSN